MFLQEQFGSDIQKAASTQTTKPTAAAIAKNIFVGSTTASSTRNLRRREHGRLPKKLGEHLKHSSHLVLLFQSLPSLPRSFPTKKARLQTLPKCSCKVRRPRI